MHKNKPVAYGVFAWDVCDTCRHRKRTAPAAHIHRIARARRRRRKAHTHSLPLNKQMMVTTLYLIKSNGLVTNIGLIDS